MQISKLVALSLVLVAVFTLSGCQWFFGGDDPTSDFELELDGANVLVSITTDDPNVVSYTVERSSDGGSSYEEISSSTNPEYTDDGTVLGTTYQYRVILVLSDNSTVTLTAQEITVPDSLNRVTNLALNVTDSSIASYTLQLSWDRVTGASFYRVYYASSYQDDPTFFENDANFTEISSLGQVSGTQATIDTSDVVFNESERYYFFVRAFTDTVSSEYSTEESYVDTPGEAKPPVKVTAEAVSGTTASIKISWEAGINAQSYRVFRFTSESGSVDDFFNTSDLSYTDSSVTESTTYWYRVVSINTDNGPSDTDDIVANDFYGAVAVQANASISAPTGIQASVDGTSVAVSWIGDAGASSYNVYRDTDPNGAFDNLVGQPSANSYTDTTVRAGVDYYYRVSSVGSASSIESALSEAAGVFIEPQITTPGSVTGVPISSTKVSLSWTASTSDVGSITYTVERRSGTEWLQTNVVKRPQTTGTVINLSAATSYPFRVYATDGNDNLSGYSSTVFVSTLPEAPTPSVESSTSSSITLSWSASNGAAGYNVYQASSVDGTYSRKNSTLIGSGSSEYEVGGLNRGTSYYYKLTVQDSDGNETDLAEVTALEATTSSLVAPIASGTDINDGEITTSWGAVTGANGYYVEYQIDGGSFSNALPDDQATTDTSVSFTPAGAASGSYVQVRIRATNGAEDSDWSDPTTTNAGVAIP